VKEEYARQIRNFFALMEGEGAGAPAGPSVGTPAGPSAGTPAAAPAPAGASAAAPAGPPLPYRGRSNLKSAAAIYDALERPAPPSGKPRVGYFCTMVPEEIIRAAGGEPVRLCSLDAPMARRGEELIPGDLCALVKSTCGSVVLSHKTDLDLLVIPAACDGKLKLAELLSPAVEIYVLDMPRTGDYLQNAATWTERLGRFLNFLKSRWKRKVGRNDLLEQCRIQNRSTDLFRKIYDLRARRPGIINAFDYFALASLSFQLDPSGWQDRAEKLLAEAEELAGNSASPSGKAAAPSGDGTALPGNRAPHGAAPADGTAPGDVLPSTANAAGKPRIFLAGSPIIYPFFKILELLDELGCEVAADSLCPSYNRFYNPVVLDEETEDGILRALGLKYMAASLCPCLLTMEKLADLVLDFSAQYRLDGVIYQYLRLCQPFEIQIVLLRQIFKERSLPFLSLKTDLGGEDTGQLKTRLEAFLEMIRR